MAGLRADFDEDLERFMDLLRWVDNASVLLGILLVIVLVVVWCLR